MLRTLKHIWSTRTNFWRTTPSSGETEKFTGCVGRELEVFATSIAASLTATIRLRSCFQLIPKREHQRVRSTKPFGVTCPNHSTSSIFQSTHYEIACGCLGWLPLILESEALHWISQLAFAMAMASTCSWARKEWLPVLIGSWNLCLG